jgi:hypothetical protein
METAIWANWFKWINSWSGIVVDAAVLRRFDISALISVHVIGREQNSQ